MIDEVRLEGDSASANASGDKQRVRRRRVIWAMLSYAASYLTILVAYALGFLPTRALIIYPALVAVLTLTFLAIIASGANRRLRDPALTLPQMTSALIPWAYVLYELDEPMARGIAVFLSIVTLLYGLLALDRRRMLIMSILTIAVYLSVLAVIAWRRPEDLVPVFDGLWLLGLVVVIAQLSWIGGFVSELRLSLRARNEALHTLATQDMLTHLPNRRYLLQRLSAEIARTRRQQQPRSVTVCLIDLDEFKRINDNLGHAVGDAVLEAAAGRMQSALRESDCLGRFGGEEFLAILPDTDLAGGRSMAERMRSTLADARVDELPNHWQLTATFGVAEIRPGERLEETLARADAALYDGKRAGRDRIVTAA
ncbi:MAG: GGDEF domain-containing protein [Pseudomonadales bacterium]